MTYLDPAPLLAHFHNAPADEIAERIGVSASFVRYWRSGTRRISRPTADRICQRVLGMHPLNVWPDTWETATDRRQPWDH